LDHVAAPQATANVVALALGLEPWRDPDTKELLTTRFYDGMTFNRTIKNFIIQTGNPGSRASGGPGWAIKREGDPLGRYNTPGALGMVDSADNTHGSQFFITLRKQKSLADRYSAFGVCGSSEVIKSIANAPKEPAKKEGKSATKPIDPVRIKRLSLSWESKEPAADSVPPLKPSAGKAETPAEEGPPGN
jgi:cyclophilin family peptidyl-prolyl cis-trans isomerase